MKKMFCSMIALLLALSLVFATPLNSLQEYYEADQSEDIDKLMSLTDFTHVEKKDRDNFRDETRQTLKALAFYFDTLSFELTDEEVYEYGDDALVYYHVKTKLQDTKSETIEIEDDYVAVMHNNNGWKVVYMQPESLFSNNMLTRETTISASESYINVTSVTTEKQPQETSQELNRAKKTVQAENGEVPDWAFVLGVIIVIFMFIVVPIALFIFWLWMLINAIRRDAKEFNKPLWILLVLFLGFIGAIIYFFAVKLRKRP